MNHDMKRYIELILTAIVSVFCSVLVFAFVAGGYMRQIDINTGHLKELESAGTKALQGHMAADARDSRETDRRLSHVEAAVESLIDLKTDVREIKVRVEDVQERQRRIEERRPAVRATTP